MFAEPRFLIIDLHKKQAVPATTDEMQALVWRKELINESYFKRINPIGPSIESEETPWQLIG